AEEFPGAARALLFGEEVDAHVDETRGVARERARSLVHFRPGATRNVRDLRVFGRDGDARKHAAFERGLDRVRQYGLAEELGDVLARQPLGAAASRNDAHTLHHASARSAGCTISPAFMSRVNFAPA